MEYEIIKEISIDANRVFEGQELLKYLSIDDLQYKIILTHEVDKILIRIIKEKQ